MIRVTKFDSFMSPRISRDRISRWGTSSTSRTLSNLSVSGPREAWPFWRTRSTLSEASSTPLYWRFEMNCAMWS